MSLQFSRKGCFKCGNLGHIAEACPSTERLCYNCRQPGHESSACPSPRSVSAKQCYSCGGVGHIQGLEQVHSHPLVQANYFLHKLNVPASEFKIVKNVITVVVPVISRVLARMGLVEGLPLVRHRLAEGLTCLRCLRSSVTVVADPITWQGIALLRLVTSLVILRIRARPATNVNRRVISPETVLKMLNMLPDRCVSSLELTLCLV
ncbi:hypothetical protein JOM56_008626 [Amanita muscaria]